MTTNDDTQITKAEMTKAQTLEERGHESAETKERRIRSFVRRSGRLTEGQQKAYNEYWPQMGLELSAVDKPMDFSSIFNRNASTTLEIGFGMGHSLVAMAQAAPEQNFLGIEVHSPGVGRCLADAAEAQLSNLRLMKDDAVDVIKQAIGDNSLSTIQIFFPDPWHKTKHQKRRLISPEFLQLCQQKLIVGGQLHLATDWQHYAKQMLTLLNEAEGFTNSADTTDGYYPRPNWRPLTKFEKRGHGLGHGVWDIIFKKNPPG